VSCDQHEQRRVFFQIHNSLEWLAAISVYAKHKYLGSAWPACCKLYSLLI